MKNEVTPDDLALVSARMIRKELGLSWDLTLFLYLAELSLMQWIEIHKPTEVARLVFKFRGFILAEFKRSDEVRGTFQVETAVGDWIAPYDYEYMSYAILIERAIYKWALDEMPNSKDVVNCIEGFNAFWRAQLRGFSSLRARRSEMVVH